MADIERDLIYSTAIPEETRDIDGILAITEGTDRGTQKSIESILRIADRMEILRRDESGKKAL